MNPAVLENWLGVPVNPGPTFDRVAGRLGYEIDDPLQFMHDELDKLGQSATGSNDFVAGAYDEFLRDPSLRIAEPGNGLFGKATDWVGGFFAGPDNKIPAPMCILPVVPNARVGPVALRRRLGMVAMGLIQSRGHTLRPHPPLSSLSTASRRPCHQSNCLRNKWKLRKLGRKRRRWNMNANRQRKKRRSQLKEP